MSREKQIEEIQNALIKIAEQPIMIEGLADWSDVIAEDLYNAGYRKIHDDNAIQCVCYALGCQAAEKIKSEVAREIIRDIIEPIWDVYKSSPHEDIKLLVALLCESIKCKLENKYTEGEG